MFTLENVILYELGNHFKTCYYFVRGEMFTNNGFGVLIVQFFFSKNPQNFMICIDSDFLGKLNFEVGKEGDRLLLKIRSIST